MQKNIDPYKVLSRFVASKKHPNGFCPGPIDGIEYMSASRIKTLRPPKGSPGLYKYRYIDGNKPPETAAKDFGRIMHHALLESADFRNRYLLVPSKSNYEDLIDTADDMKGICKDLNLPATGTKPVLEDRLLGHDLMLRNRMWKYILLDFEAKKNEKSIVVTNDQAQAVIDMINNLENSLEAWKLLTDGIAERAFYWWDEEFQVTWFGYIDYMRFVEDKDGNITCWLTELKTSKDGSPWGFQKEIDEYGYHIQTWLYRRAIHGITGFRVNVIQLVIDKTPPYGIATYQPDVFSQETAEWEVQRALRKKAQCEASGRWPVYEERVLPIGLPGYAKWRIEEQAERENEQ